MFLGFQVARSQAITYEDSGHAETVQCLLNEDKASDHGNRFDSLITAAETVQCLLNPVRTTHDERFDLGLLIHIQPVP